MLFIVGGEIREVHFPPVIKDEQWSKIANLSGLPPENREARYEIDDYIGYYQELQLDAQVKYGTVWNEVRRARDVEIKSRDTLDAMISNANFLSALAIGLDGQEKIPEGEVEVIREWLKGLCKEKNIFVDWYDKALRRLHHYEQTGPKTGRNSLLTLVWLLNGLLIKYTGKRISRAKRTFECVWEVCQIANPVFVRNPCAGRKTVDEVVREVVMKVRANWYTCEVGSWEELMPNWKEPNELSIEDEKLGIKVKFDRLGDAFHWDISTSPRTPRNASPIFCPGLFRGNDVHTYSHSKHLRRLRQRIPNCNRMPAGITCSKYRNRSVSAGVLLL
jgi:hypothetical protein